jgi:hypothetical protein
MLDTPGREHRVRLGPRSPNRIRTQVTGQRLQAMAHPVGEAVVAVAFGIGGQRTSTSTSPTPTNATPLSPGRWRPAPRNSGTASRARTRGSPSPTPKATSSASAEPASADVAERLPECPGVDCQRGLQGCAGGCVGLSPRTRRPPRRRSRHGAGRPPRCRRGGSRCHQRGDALLRTQRIPHHATADGRTGTRWSGELPSLLHPTRPPTHARARGSARSLRRVLGRGPRGLGAHRDTCPLPVQLRSRRRRVTRCVRPPVVTRDGGAVLSRVA